MIGIGGMPSKDSLSAIVHGAITAVILSDALCFDLTTAGMVSRFEQILLSNGTSTG